MEFMTVEWRQFEHYCLFSFCESRQNVVHKKSNFFRLNTFNLLENPFGAQQSIFILFIFVQLIESKLQQKKNQNDHNLTRSLR